MLKMIVAKFNVTISLIVMFPGLVVICGYGLDQEVVGLTRKYYFLKRL